MCINGAEIFSIYIYIYIYIYFSMRTATNNKAMMNFDYLRHRRYTVDTFG